MNGKKDQAANRRIKRFLMERYGLKEPPPYVPVSPTLVEDAFKRVDKVSMRCALAALLASVTAAVLLLSFTSVDGGTMAIITYMSGLVAGSLVCWIHVKLDR